MVRLKKKSYLKNKTKLRILSSIMMLMFLITNTEIVFAEASKYNVKRFYGENRYETSFNIAKEFESGTLDNIIVANGTNFPDALTGSILSKGLKAPILLLDNKADGSKDSINYIKEHLKKDGTIYILGGTGAVSDDFVNQFNALGFKNITRLGGTDRFDTNKKIIDQVAPSQGTPIIIANGYNFADALSISSIAAIKGYPIFISQSNSIPDNIKSKISEIQPSKVYILGGNSVLTEDITSQVKTLTSLKDVDILRLGGQDRYETSLKICSTFKLDTNTIIIASGENFPDALSGSALAAKNSSPIILTNGKDIIKQKEYIDNYGFTNIMLMGGTSSIDKSIEECFNKSTQDNTSSGSSSGGGSSSSIDNNTDRDNDGISDKAEAIYKTDPNNPDTDGDGLNDGQEVLSLNSNPLVKDTDGDRLTDGEEALIVATNPLNKDTDGNGITDDLEDFDKDTISNYDEIVLGGDPNSDDTDFDQLKDGDEKIRGTELDNMDTDEDGVSDFKEVELGTNPLVKDTDGNGILDSDEIFNTKLSAQEGNLDEKVKPTLEVDLKGNQIESLSIKKIDKNDLFLSSDIPGFIGSGYEFKVDGVFTSAKLTFEFDSALLSTVGFTPRIYYFNEETQMLEELQNQTVEGNIVSTNLSHFSKYILLNKTEFDKVWENEIKPPVTNDNTTKQAIAVAFVIDCSQSMDDNDPNGIRKDTAKQFVDKLGENDRAAVIGFTKTGTLLSGFTNKKDELKSSIDSIVNDDGYNSNSGTALSEGMKLALQQFNNSDKDTIKYIIALTDGQDNYYYDYSSLIQQLKDNNIIVYTIGLGSSVDDSLLTNIATNTGGKYYYANVDSDLIEEFKKVEYETIDYTKDSDEDGVCDYYENAINEGKARLGTGKSLVGKLDLNAKDTDGDGLNDGEEIYAKDQGGKVYLFMNSDPTSKDSDSDGWDDKEDPVPLVIGLKDGVVGELKIFSSDVGDSSWKNLNGHAFLTYTSFVNNSVSLEGWWSVKDVPNNKWVYYKGPHELGLHRNNMISIGTFGNRPTEEDPIKEIYINIENLSGEDTYPGRVSLEKMVTNNEVDIISSFTKSHNKWTAFDNCSSFATGLWNRVFKDHLSARGVPIFKNPTSLMYNIKQRSGWKENDSFIGIPPK